MILDTNALSAAADGDQGVLEAVAETEQFAVPVIVLGEYRLGIAQSRRRKDYEDWLRACVDAVTVLDVDEETTCQYARIGLELKKNRQADTVQQSLDWSLVPSAFAASSARARHFDFVPGIKKGSAGNHHVAGDLAERHGSRPITFGENTRRVRASRTEVLGHMTDATILARSLGYTSESAFSNAFKRVTGKAPKTYRSAVSAATPMENKTTKW